MIVETFRSLCNALRNQGWKDTLSLAISRITDSSFDLHYRTDTFGWVSPSDFTVADHIAGVAEPYKPSNARSLREVLSAIDLPDPKVFVDIGCGKGRAMIVAAQSGFSIVRGIECSGPLARVAISNLKMLIEKRIIQSSFNVAIGDGCSHIFSDDENCFYLFKPFDQRSDEKVVRQIEQSLARKPRKAFVIYKSPTEPAALSIRPSLSLQSVNNLHGHRYWIYASPPN